MGQGEQRGKGHGWRWRGEGGVGGEREGAARQIFHDPPSSFLINSEELKQLSLLLLKQKSFEFVILKQQLQVLKARQELVERLRKSNRINY